MPYHLIVLTVIVGLFLPSSLLAQIRLSGHLSGTLPPRNYLVVGQIRIDSTDRLTVEPGANFYFNGNYDFLINGVLNAAGTEDDSIIFTVANPDSCWKGIHFSNTADTSLLSFCYVSCCSIPMSAPGGALTAFNTRLRISQCTFTDNFRYQDGGAMHLDSAWAEITGCNISGNIVNFNGGGIYIYESQCLISDCLIDNNQIMENATGGGGIYCKYSTVLVENSIISNNFGGTSLSYGGGIRIINSIMNITGSCINNNFCANQGGGIRLGTGSQLQMDHCVIAFNEANDAGGGICIDSFDSFPQFISNCTFYGNITHTVGSAISCIYSGSAYVVNSIIANNQDLYGFYISYPDLNSFDYGCAFENEGGNFGGALPIALGELTTVNANGDPCDNYYNIFLNPLFADTSNGDFHLTENSPCIDAGAPDSPLDPDSTIADIGAFYFPHTVDVEYNDPAEIPTEFCFYNCYPNPFNPETILKFDLPVSSEITLKVYDITGRVIVSLAEGLFSPGVYQFKFNGSNLSSGIYFAILIAGNFSQTQKLVLMK